MGGYASPVADPEEVPRVFEPPTARTYRLVSFRERSPWTRRWAALLLVAAAAVSAVWVRSRVGAGRCAALEGEFWDSKGHVPYVLWEASRCRAAQGQATEAYQDYVQTFFHAVDHGDLPLEEVTADFSAALRRLGDTRDLAAFEDCGFARAYGTVPDNVFPERFLHAARCYEKAGRLAEARRTYEELLGYIEGHRMMVHAGPLDEGQVWKLNERVRRELTRLPEE